MSNTNVPLEKRMHVVSYDANNILIARELIFSDNISIGFSTNRVNVNIPSSINATIGSPTSGMFGTENLAGLLSTDGTADAFDKVSHILEDLRPAGPPDLATFTSVSLVDTTYSAYATIAPYNLCLVVENNPSNKPIMMVSGFRDGNKGTLSAFVCNSSSPASIQGSKVLTTNDDSGIYGNFLRIISDTTINAFYASLVASIGDNLLSGVFSPSNTQIYSMQLQHSLFGNTNTIQFYQDDAYITPPIATNASITSVSGDLTYISGVPTYDGNNFTFTSQVYANQCVRKFYNSSWVARASGTGIITAYALPTGSDRDEGSTPLLVISSSIMAGVLFTNNLSIIMTVQNSAGTQSSTTANHPTTIIRIDTVSLFATPLFSPESNRNNSFVGQYPAPTIQSYDSTQSLVSNYELQCIDGLYQYPPIIDYTLYNPVGPNYASLLSDGGYRHYTQNMGTITAASYIEFDLLNANNFDTEIIDPTIRMYVSVVGVIGWIDANAPYSGTGHPISDGTPALDMSLSSSVHKRITFGGNLPSGYVLIRISLPVGSTISFGGFSQLIWS
jgi:hypothetical protein